MQTDLLKKYKSLKFESPQTLFPPDFSLARKGICPYCLRKLTPMLKKPLLYCKNKTHKTFIMGKGNLKQL